MSKKIFLIISCMILFFLSSRSLMADSFEWKWLHPYPYGEISFWCSIYNSNNFFLAGNNGWFLKSTNSGLNWFQNQYAGCPDPYPYTNYTPVYDGFVFDENKIILVGSQGARMTTNGGITFSTIPGITNVDILDVHFINNMTGYMCGSGSTLKKSTNGGNTWSSINTGITGTYNSLCTLNDTLIFIATSASGTILKSTNGGINWNSVSTGVSGSYNNVTLLNKDTIIACGTGNKFTVSTNGGVNWFNRNPGMTNNEWFGVKVVQKSNEKEIFLNGYNTNILRTTNLGTNWETISSLVPGQQFSNGVTAFAVADTGNTLLTAGWATLTLRKNGSITSLMKGVRFGGISGYTQSNNALAVRNNGMKIWTVGEPQVLGSTFNQILYSSDGGNTWGFQPTPNANIILYDIDMIDDNTGYTAGGIGTSGVLLKTTNGGIDWQNISVAGMKKIISLDFVNANTGWIYGPDTTIYKTTNGGGNWITQKTTFMVNGPADFPINTHIKMFDENTGWICGGSYGGMDTVAFINKTTNGGTNWLAYRADVSVQAIDICMLNANTGYMCAAASKFRKTINGGIKWDTLAIPFPPEEYDFKSVDFIDVNNGVTIDNGGATLITTNGGASWIYKLGLSYSNYMEVKMVSSFPNPLMYAVGGNSSVFKLGDKLTPIDEYSEWTNSYPKEFNLKQNYPNPFNPVTKIEFSIPKEGRVKLLVYDAAGKLIQTLINDIRFNQGTVSQLFNASSLSSGVYYYSLIFNGEFVSTKKMVLVK